MFFPRLYREVRDYARQQFNPFFGQTNQIAADSPIWLSGLADDTNQVVASQVDTPASRELAIGLRPRSEEDRQFYSAIFDLYAHIFAYAASHRDRCFAFQRINLVRVQIAARVPIMVEHVQRSLINDLAQRSQCELLSSTDNQIVTLKGITSGWMDSQRQSFGDFVQCLHVFRGEICQDLQALLKLP